MIWIKSACVVYEGEQGEKVAAERAFRMSMTAERIDSFCGYNFLSSFAYFRPSTLLPQPGK